VAKNHQKTSRIEGQGKSGAPNYYKPTLYNCTEKFRIVGIDHA
jgi:hypothetical protein